MQIIFISKSRLNINLKVNHERLIHCAEGNDCQVRERLYGPGSQKMHYLKPLKRPTLSPLASSLQPKERFGNRTQE